MELMHQMTPHLKRLRLSGVLETLESRNQEAIDGRWTYVEFLARLVEDEVERRAQKQLGLRIRRAGVNTTKTLETFNFDFNPTINRQQILSLATCTYLRQKRNALICGPTGVGKTHLAQALAHEACRRGYSVLFANTYRMVSARYEQDVAMKTKLAHFPFVKTLDQFDFAVQPAINERQVRELATLSFIANGENVLFLGPPGVGKTHLAIALGMAAIQQATSVYFTTMVDLLDQLHRDAKEDRLDHRRRTLCRPKLLILDEIGYFPLDRMTAQFVFQLISRRYGRGSVILTSSKSYGEWGDCFAGQVLAAAILDRLLHYSTTISIRGQSYRRREKRKAGVFTDLAELQEAGSIAKSNV